MDEMQKLAKENREYYEVFAMLKEWRQKPKPARAVWRASPISTARSQNCSMLPDASWAIQAANVPARASRSLGASATSTQPFEREGREAAGSASAASAVMAPIQATRHRMLRTIDSLAPIQVDLTECLLSDIAKNPA